ncbi:MAG: DNA-binding protein [Candidatus Pacearchaeota archaeon]
MESQNLQNNQNNAQEKEKETIKPKKLEENKNDNIIFIGNKPLINYVRSISVQLTIKKSPEIIVRARGKFISKAVDVVEVAKRTFLEKEKIRIKDIKIASEEFEKEGKKLNVSSIDIILGR